MTLPILAPESADTLDRPAERLPNPARLYHDAKAPGSRPAIRAALNRIAGWLLGRDAPCSWEETCAVAWWEIRARHVKEIRARLAECSAPRTVNRDLSLLRNVLTTAWENETMPDEAYNRARHVKGVDKDTTKAGRALDVAELRTLVRVGKAWALEREPEGKLGRRALAVLALMYGAGLRRTEVAGVLTANVDLAGSKIALVGKRNKRRIAYLAPGWGTFVQEWAGRADPSPRLIGVRSPESVGRIIDALQGRAKIAPFTPHDLRRSFGTHLLDAGKDLSLARDLLGHDDIRTTILYDRRGEDELREAVADLPGPEDQDYESNID